MFALDQLNNLFEVENRSNLKLLTNDARVLFAIKANPGQPVKYYLKNSGLSYRGFYNVYNNLIQKGLIEISCSTADQRSRNVS
jgi:DNA-binding MarR family transcriptional regulator